MPKRASKPRLPDPNLTAIAIVEGVTGETLVKKPASIPQPIPVTITAGAGKNQAAVLLGHLGGLKGGLARAKSLSKKARSDIARKAAMARWGTKNGKKAQKKTGENTTSRL